MATSLKTANYGFGKYAPDDVTSYLTDYNGTMDKIDSAIKGVSDVADEAKATADSNLNNIASLTQGLTATNKNVENLGKTQTAQQTEIDDIKAEVGSIVIGETKSVSFTPTTDARYTSVIARNVGESAIGRASFSLDKKTLTEFIAIDASTHLFEIGYAVGNVFNIKAGTLSSGLAVISSGTLDSPVFNGAVLIGLFYNVATNKTSLGIIGSGSDLTFPGGTLLGMLA